MSIQNWQIKSVYARKRTELNWVHAQNHGVIDITNNTFSSALPKKGEKQRRYNTYHTSTPLALAVQLKNIISATVTTL